MAPLICHLFYAIKVATNRKIRYIIIGKKYLYDEKRREAFEMYKACILDIDGTLLDSVESIAYVANQVLTTYGLEPQPVESYNYFAGDGADELMKRALTAAGDPEMVHYEEGRALYREIFAKDPLYHVKAFDGLKEILAKLKEKGVRLAVLSNKPHPAAVKAIEGIYGKDCFDVILGQREGMERKPSPEGAWIIAEDFDVKPEECMYVGDTNTDMQTGKSAGMYTIGVTWGFRDREELEANHADTIIDHPAELFTIWENSKNV